MPGHNILVAVVGCGLVGSEFVRQLLSIPQSVSPFKLISLSSSKRTVFVDKSRPIGPDVDWMTRLAESPDSADLKKLTARLAQLTAEKERVVLVDNTSSEEVAGLYPLWLKQGINIVTPNKKAFSGDEALFEKILDASRESGARFLNEATVGAGLPVIAPLKDLLATGDKIIKIEGVFSGTLSYIFNEFSTAKPGGPAFSSVVAVARERGFTEPHPADDLNGFDVARKLTILSRIISSDPTTSSSTVRSIPIPLDGISTGDERPPDFDDEVANLRLPTFPSLKSFASVQTTSLIPPALEGISTGDEFIARLAEFDDEFANLRREAHKENKVLRFVGVVDVAGGQVRAGLEKYPIDHPFATSLGGSDNIVMFHTQRYSPRPLIVQGAGAGAAVTAMGVLGDLWKLT